MSSNNDLSIAEIFSLSVSLLIVIPIVCMHLTYSHEYKEFEYINSDIISYHCEDAFLITLSNCKLVIEDSVGLVLYASAEDDYKVSNIVLDTDKYYRFQVVYRGLWFFKRLVVIDMYNI